MKKNSAQRFRPRRQTQRYGLESQISPDTPSGEPADWESEDPVNWPSSNKVLTDYLKGLGVLRPGRVARSLLNEFGTLPELLFASHWRLRRTVGWRLASSIAAACHVIRTTLAEPLTRGPIVPRSQALVTFLQAQIGFLHHERLLAIYVDDELRLLRIKKIADGGLRDAQVDFRKIVSCGLSLAASGIILVHNHPSGIPEPSQADLTVTSRLKNLFAELDLHLIDHLIVARGKVVSIQDHWREAKWTSGKHEARNGCTEQHPPALDSDR